MSTGLEVDIEGANPKIGKMKRDRFIPRNPWIDANLYFPPEFSRLSA